ncbi:hypothetical protein GPB2148_1193 [marine gamma proteobacterium HTCC2148]|nr:hypothetical protein GPB2148_1193 [marine gamma proteobacterium HTCC2148]
MIAGEQVGPHAEVIIANRRVRPLEPYVKQDIMDASIGFSDT